MKLKKSDFFYNVIKLLMGNVGVQVIGILFLPFLTRIFPPAIFGIYSVFFAFVENISIISCLSYQLAIVLPKEDEKAINILFLCFIIIILITVATSFFIYFGKDWLIKLLKAPSLEKYLYLIPVGILLNGLGLTFKYWGMRKKYFGYLSISRVISSFVENGIRLCGGILKFINPLVFITGYLMRNFLTVFLLGLKAFTKQKLNFSCLKKETILKVIKEYKNFPLYSSWSGFVNSLSNHIPVWLLTFYFSPEIVGYYALVRMTLIRAVSLFATSIREVFFQKGSESKYVGNLDKLTLQIFEKLVILIIFPSIILSILGKDLFILFFGEKWKEAGIYSQIFTVWIFFNFLSSSIIYLVSILEKQKMGLIFNILLLCGRALSLVLGGLLGNVHLTIILFSVSGALGWAIFCFKLLNLVGISLKIFLKILLKYLVYCLPLVGIIILLKIFHVNMIIILSACIAGGTYYYTFAFRQTKK